MKPTPNYKRTKYSCYFTYLANSSVFMLPPILFLPFRNIYGISYTLLGTLVLINFLTQLGVDLIFSAFSHRFNMKMVIRTMPVLCSFGLLLYALIPMLWPDYAYLGFAIGTLIFSVAAGLSEVFLTPTVAALPSKNRERDVSTLHSLYAYGSLMVIVVSTLFLHFAGEENWPYLTMFWALFPLVSWYLFSTSYIPDFNAASSKPENSIKNHKFGFALIVLCIFLGGAAETTMSNWVSSYVENVLLLDKALGDILGMAVFAVMLGIARTLYGKYGRNITRVLLYGMIGAVACYIIASLSQNAVLSLAACGLTGFATSLLWPGSLVLMEEKFPGAGVGAYALMAAGGDLGASFAPQLMGVIVDEVAKTEWAASFADMLSMNAEQIGMRVGILISTIFPILGAVVVILIKRYFKNVKKCPIIENSGEGNGKNQI